MKAYLYSLSSKLIPFILRMNALKSADGTIPVPRCSIVRDLDSMIYRTCNVYKVVAWQHGYQCLNVHTNYK